MPRFTLDPDATLDFSFDWRDWLQTGETITSQAVTVTAGATKQSSSQAGGIVTVWLTGGVAGSDVIVTCHIVTSANRQDDRSLTVSVRKR